MPLLPPARRRSPGVEVPGAQLARRDDLLELQARRSQERRDGVEGQPPGERLALTGEPGGDGRPGLVEAHPALAVGVHEGPHQLRARSQPGAAPEDVQDGRLGEIHRHALEDDEGRHRRIEPVPVLPGLAAQLQRDQGQVVGEGCPDGVLLDGGRRRVVHLHAPHLGELAGDPQREGVQAGPEDEQLPPAIAEEGARRVLDVALAGGVVALDAREHETFESVDRPARSRSREELDQAERARGGPGEQPLGLRGRAGQHQVTVPGLAREEDGAERDDGGGRAGPVRLHGSPPGGCRW